MSNQLNIQTGGHRWRNEDIMFLQEAYNEVVKGLASGIRPDASYILTGMEFTEPTAGNYELSEGFMVFRGEVLYSPAQSFVVDSSEKVIIIQETVDGTKSPKLYDDGLNKNVHMVRRAQMKILGSLEAEPKEDFITLPRQNSGKVVLELSNGWVGGTNPVPTPYYRIESGRAYAYGDITFPEAIPLNNAPFYEFPENVRPIENQHFIVLTSDHFDSPPFYMGNPGYTWIRVDTNGRCWADPVIGAGTSINLSGVSFQINF